MELSFTIEYQTHWGEEVGIVGSIPELGNGNDLEPFLLHTKDGKIWEGTLETGHHPTLKKLTYNYRIYRDGKPARKEWDGIPHALLLNDDAGKRHYKIEDKWSDRPSDGYFYSSAFAECLFRHAGHSAAPPENGECSLLLQVAYPRILPGYALAVCGFHPALGRWNPSQAAIMDSSNFPVWQLELDLSLFDQPSEFKFLLYNTKEGHMEMWEEGANRLLMPQPAQAGTSYVQTLASPQFILPEWKGAGVAIPVFSLRSEHSFGIGDFGDLKAFIQWAAQARLKFVQLLPVNDTTMTHTWMDSYPYNGISIYALNPMYIDLHAIGELADPARRSYFKEQQQKLNANAAVDYEAVDRMKWAYLHEMFAQEKWTVLASDEFRRFFADNKDWLVPYAAYCYLREQYGTSDFHSWESFATFNREQIEELCAPSTARYPDIAFFYYVQHVLHRQLRAASELARRLGVALKGDIPIGISRCSVEAWTEPELFNMDGQAGAPPDDFSTNGQNWGFPTYNWNAMALTGYAWWKKRFKKMAEYFDAYRIDHILGFFRIWEIPADAVHGLLGHFEPSLPLSQEEIEARGLPWNPELYLQPYIDDKTISQLFGTQAEWVRSEFMEPSSVAGRYALKTQYATQRQIETYFRGMPEEHIPVRDGLYAIISNVLFLADRHDSFRYHPRIDGKRTSAYQLLDEAGKHAFDCLYEDYYYHRHNGYWYDEAMKRLPALIGSTGMLVCGEDLGMIPACVPRAMDTLQVLSLEVERMPKEWAEFGTPSRYPYLSVCTFSTHDMPTLRGWWEEDPERSARYYTSALGFEGKAPAIATPEICTAVVERQLRAGSILCILAWQDWMSIDGRLRQADPASERINIPANPRHYWRWRMHLTVEQLLACDSLNEKIKKLIAQNGRDPKI